MSDQDDEKKPHLPDGNLQMDVPVQAQGGAGLPAPGQPGIRSPLMGGAVPPPAPDRAQQAEQARPDARRSSFMVKPLEFRKEPRRIRRKIVLAFLFGMLLTGLGSWLFPEYSAPVWRPALTKLEQNLWKLPVVGAWLEEEGSVITTRGDEDGGMDGAGHARTADAAERCSRLLRAGRKLAPANRIAACALLLGKPEKVPHILRGSIRKLKSSSRIVWNERQSLVYILSLRGQLLSFRSDEARRLTDRLCRTWQPGIPCLGKLLVRAVQNRGRLLETGFREVYAGRKKMPRWANALLWWAGGVVAMADGHLGKARKRLDAAVRLTPDSHPDILKAVYEQQALLARRMGDRKAAIRIVDDAVRSLPDRRGVTGSTRILAEMTRGNGEALRKYLLRRNLHDHGLGDAALFTALGEGALTFGYTKEWSLYMKEVRSGMGRFGSRDPWFLKRLQMWDVRRLLAERNYAAAGKKLGKILRGKKTAEALHLKGLAVLGRGNKSRYNLKAARIFVEATRKNLHWQSVFANGKALLTSGKTELGISVLRSMEKWRQKPGARKWAEIARVEVYLSKGQNQKAIKLTRFLARRYPSSFAVQSLRARVLNLTGQRKKAVLVRGTIVQKGLDKKVFLNDPFHPLGPLARLRS